MRKRFLIETCSNSNYEGMVVDISFNNQRIAMINYDKGIDNVEIGILSSGEESSGCAFPLKDFFNILEEAKQIAIRCAKEDEHREI